jgi:decaprenylphospho-beta-D-ribofuranose 2-oxidase
MSWNATSSVSGRQATLQGWGRSHESECFVVQATDDHLLGRTVASAAAGELFGHLIPRGGGNSYGDAGTVNRGTVLDMRGRRQILAFDREAGLVVAEAGVTFGQILELTLPLGWMPPVLPGTPHVTLGGAVAADVHGKNHPRAGSIGRHVPLIQVLRPIDTEPRTLRQDDKAQQFWATVGGLGLTGVITTVALQLQRVAPTATTQRTRCQDLAAVMAQMDDDHARANEGTDVHSVAWLDSTAPSDRLGRGIVQSTTLDVLPHSTPLDAHPTRYRSAGPNPSWPAVRCLTRRTITAANRARWAAPVSRQHHESRLPDALLPLRHGDFWPALFGPGGLVQYQFNVPTHRTDVLGTALTMLRHNGMPPALTSLKRLGAANPAPLTFAHPGWTMAMDLPARWTDLPGTLRALDELVASAEGRVYLAKDSRLSAPALARMYPDLPAWQTARAVMDPRGLLGSDLSARVGLTRREQVSA